MALPSILLDRSGNLQANPVLQDQIPAGFSILQPGNAFNLMSEGVSCPVEHKTSAKSTIRR